MKIVKEFRWEMGHRLPAHTGSCRNIHGHSYKMFIEVEGDLDKNGMIVDYYDLQRAAGPVLEKLDHAFMVNRSDREVLEFLEKVKSKKVVVDFDTTVENICSYIAAEIKKIDMPPNVKALRIRVYETHEDYAEETVSVR